jgi:hypothetical protein
MDRRQVLAGMAAMGVVGTLNPSALLCAQTSEPQTSEPERVWPPPCLAHSYLPETRQMLGPVKTCIEESPNNRVEIREYGPDRKLLAFRTERDGKVLDSSSERDHSETYDAQGRILSNRWAVGDGTFGETFYEYDEAGRQTTMTFSRNSNRTEYFYDADGIMKTCIETFDPKNPDQANMPHAFWGSRTLGVPRGGSAVTTYDVRDDVLCGGCGKQHRTSNPVEIRILTADGRLVSEYVRKYDASSRVVEEKTLQQNDGLFFLEQMTPEQKAAWPPEEAQAWAKQLNEMRGKLPPETRYKCDEQGRVIEKRDRNRLFAQTTTIDYNDRGDIERKHETFTDKSVLIRNELPEDTDVHYSYQYDSYGNWTERTMTVANDGSSVYTSRTRRVLTYY